MGFFSDLKPDLSFFRKKKEEPNPEVISPEEKKPQAEYAGLWEIPFPPLPRPEAEEVANPRRVGSAEMVGLGAQLRKARENIEYCRLANFSRPIMIIGPKNSGKSLLAKVIMQDNEITYTVIDLRRIRQPEEIYKQLESIGAYRKGIILEGAEELSDWNIINAVNTLLSSGEKNISFNHTIRMSMVAVIITLKKENVYLNLKNACPLKIVYKRDDYVLMFLRACKKAGYDFPNNRLHIDNKAVAFMGNLLGRNIVSFEKWAKHLMEMTEKKKGLTVTMDNIMEFMPQMLDFKRP